MSGGCKDEMERVWELDLVFKKWWGGVRGENSLNAKGTREAVYKIILIMDTTELKMLHSSLICDSAADAVVQSNPDDMM